MLIFNKRSCFRLLLIRVYGDSLYVPTKLDFSFLLVWEQFGYLLVREKYF